jgi:SAM-dependent methyltransferase
MPNDAEDCVKDIYRALLKREPDIDGLRLFSDRLRSTGLRAVLQDFLMSDEFMAKREFPQHDLNSMAPMAVQTSLSAQALDGLWAHVARVWTGLGKKDPYWSVLTDERYRTSNMTDASIVEEFYASGETDLQYFSAFLARSGLLWKPDMIAAEYGCGLGRVTRFLAKKVARVIAYDISMPHLSAAQTRLDREAICNVDYVHVTQRSDLNTMTKIDLFFSLIVLQHNPPPIILDILQTAFRALNPGGLAFFQVPVYAQNYSFSYGIYRSRLGSAGSMEMHFVPQACILELAQNSGMAVLQVLADGMVGNNPGWLSNTFLLRKKQ